MIQEMNEKRERMIIITIMAKKIFKSCANVGGEKEGGGKGRKNLLFNAKEL
jgi:hypothetical protein